MLNVGSGETRELSGMDVLSAVISGAEMGNTDEIES